MLTTITRYLIALLLLLFSSRAQAQSHQATLTFTGKITAFTESTTQSYSFTERDLLALPQHTIETTTSWTPKSTFVGPRLADLLAKIGATGTMLKIHTLDEYTYSIPASDALRYDVILAHTMNQHRLKVSDFGPLFVIYPRDKYPKELNTPTSEAKFSWQVNGIIVQ